jgi:hypothetical protein
MNKNEFKLLVKEVITECMDELAPKTKKNTVKLKKSQLKEMIKDLVLTEMLESEDTDPKIKAALSELKKKRKA